MSSAATQLIDVTPNSGSGIARRFWSATHQTPRPVSRTRRTLALAIAAAADALQLGLAPLFVEGFVSGFDDVLDVAVAGALIALLGVQPRLLLAMAAELVPGMSLFPTWTAAVLTLPAEASEPGTLP